MNIYIKIKSMIRDPDVRHFLKFFLFHPYNVWKRINNNKIPKYIRNYYFESKLQNRSSIVLKHISVPTGLRKEKNEDASLGKFIKVRLAGTTIKLNVHCINWTRLFDDPEDVAAYHRFIWLYKWVIENLTESNRENLHKIIAEIIYSWIENIGSTSQEDKHFEIWQTYTVSERIMNWSILLSITSTKSFHDEKIIDSLIKQLEYIKCHFEYHGEEYTGNHFCNNGRALYIVGSILSLKAYADLGRIIILHEFERVIVDQCFLREGSVHYQFLYTKWFCDLYWIADNCTDTIFLNLLRIRLKYLLNGCRYFITEIESCQKEFIWTIPYIGDISPDYPPNWLLGVPWVAEYFLNNQTFMDLPKQKGYHTLFLTGKSIKSEGVVNENINIPNITDWGKAYNNRFMLFSHVNHSLYPNNLTGHFHHDSGGFVLYADKKPLFIDCGRTHYGLDHVSLRGKNYTGHNILAIDRLNPEINMRTFFTRAFLECYAKEAPILTVDHNNTSVKISIDGYKRHKNVGLYTREFVLSKENIKITDIIKGKGRYEITLLFHIKAQTKVRLKTNSVVLYNGKNCYRMSFSEQFDDLKLVNGKNSDVFGHYAEEYGEDSVCNTLIYKKYIKLPWKIQTNLEII